MITHYFSLTKIISIYTVLGGIVPSLAPLKFVTATAIIGFIYELFERTFWSALLPGKRRKRYLFFRLFFLFFFFSFFHRLISLFFCISFLFFFFVFVYFSYFLLRYLIFFNQIFSLLI
jgi:hypothetical protein